MLRKLSTLILCLVAAVATASAQTPPYNEIWYTTTDGRTISFNADNLVSNSYNNGRGILKFEDRVISIGERAFEGCSSLTSITIPESVTKIENYAFAGCSSLTSITIPDSITNIGASVLFEGCDDLNLKDVNVNITNLAEYCKRDEYAAYDLPVNTHLYIDNLEITELVIPNSVTSIGKRAFLGCSSLTSITIPESVISIRSDAFLGCSSLTSITIPNSVTEIGGWAFAGCSCLTSITIPESVTEIGVLAFENCSSLRSITCLATTPPAIYDLSIAKTTMIYVPKEAVIAYIKDPNWAQYKTQIKAIK